MAVVGAYDGDDGDLGLDGEMEGALLEWKQIGLVVIRTGSFGENEDDKLVGDNALSSRSESGDGRFGVCTVDENGIGKRH